MESRYFCLLHRKPMTSIRNVHSGQPVRRCEDCLREAREMIRTQIAAFEASQKDTHPKNRECGRAT